MCKFICKSKNKPTVYKNDKQLIKYLKQNLKEQRKIISTEKGIKKNEVKDEELILNIGYAEYKIENGLLVSNKEDTTEGKTKVEINFDFNFGNIISKLPKLKNKDKKYICPYYLNCCNVTFKSGKDSKNGADFKRIVFEEKVYFTYSIFEGEADFKWAEF